MGKVLTCTGCNLSVEMADEHKGFHEYNKYGFTYVWDISNGLKDIHICNKCADKIREHISIIENVCKTDIDFINFASIRD